MRQIGGTKGVVEIRRHTRGVPHHEPRQQRSGIGTQPVGGLPQPGTQMPRQPLKGGRRTDLDRRRIGGDPQHGGNLVGRGQRRYGARHHPDTCRRQQPAPCRRDAPASFGAALIAAASALPYDHQRRRPYGGDRAVRCRDADGLGSEHQYRGRPSGASHLGAGQMWIAGHFQLRRDPRVALRQGRQRPAPHIRRMQCRRRSPSRGTQQHRGQGHERPCGPAAGRAGTARPRRSPGVVGPRPDDGPLRPLRPLLHLHLLSLVRGTLRLLRGTLRPASHHGHPQREHREPCGPATGHRHSPAGSTQADHRARPGRQCGRDQP